MNTERPRVSETLGAANGRFQKLNAAINASLPTISTVIPGHDSRL
ncbi:hypothetical protein F383_34158 [Gossypium arboreum]|uniref:Uncharacterized protein n=1 Tax=Gossypium arboreum TaxID=29729 RepID=A0A0B0N3H6_GOSAR|nr:hypothetical protein F383_34158 [Gossypium arboreum]